MVILVLTIGLASLLSSPNVPPVTVRSWTQVARRLPGHRRQRTERHQLDRDLRPAV